LLSTCGHEEMKISRGVTKKTTVLVRQTNPCLHEKVYFFAVLTAFALCVNVMCLLRKWCWKVGCSVCLQRLHGVHVHIKTITPLLFRKKLRDDCSEEMLAIIRCRIFCLLVCYLNI